MSEWAVGYAIGIATGLAIGLVSGRKQKPWSEMTDKEKKIRIWLIASGAILVIAGLIALILHLLMDLYIVETSLYF